MLSRFIRALLFILTSCVLRFGHSLKPADLEVASLVEVLHRLLLSAFSTSFYTRRNQLFCGCELQSVLALRHFRISFSFHHPSLITPSGLRRGIW